MTASAGILVIALSKRFLPGRVVQPAPGRHNCSTLLAANCGGRIVEYRPFWDGETPVATRPGSLKSLSSISFACQETAPDRG